MSYTTDYTDNLELWLKAESLSGTDGAEITGWADSSSNAHSVAAGYHGWPDLAERAINGFNAAAFNVDTMECGSASDWDFMHSLTGCEVFLLFAPDTDAGTASAGPLVASGEYSTDVPGFNFLYTYDGANIELRVDVNDGADVAMAYTTLTGLANGEFALISAWYKDPGNDTDPACGIRVNGQTVACNARYKASAGGSANNALRTGSQQTQSRGIRGKIAEVRVYDGKLSEANRHKVESNMLAKFARMNQMETTIISDGAHNAFGGLCKLENDGEAMVVYRAGTMHVGNDQGVIACQTTSDYGRTWSPKQTIVEHSQYDLRGPKVSVIEGIGSGGADRLFLTCNWYNHTDGNAVMEDTIRVLYSDDWGETWSAPATVDTDWSHRDKSVSPVVELADGNLGLLLSGKDTLGGYESVELYVSADGSDAWLKRATVADGPGNSKSFDEAALFVYPDDTINLVALFRNSTDNSTWRATSTNSGANWGSPALSLDDSLSFPNGLKDSTGRIWLVYRDYGSGSAPHRARLAYTDDKGANWTQVYEDMNDWYQQMAYAQPIEWAPGSIGYVLFAENGQGNGTICDARYGWAINENNFGIMQGASGLWHAVKAIPTNPLLATGVPSNFSSMSITSTGRVDAGALSASEVNAQCDQALADAGVTTGRMQRLDRIVSGRVTVTGAVTSTGGVTVRQYDDYDNAQGRALEWSSTGGLWNGGTLGAASVRLAMRHKLTGATLSRTGSVVSSTAPQQVRVNLPSTFTATMRLGQVYDYQLRAQSTAGKLETLDAGEITVDESLLGAAT